MNVHHSTIAMIRLWRATKPKTPSELELETAQRTILRTLDQAKRDAAREDTARERVKTFRGHLRPWRPWLACSCFGGVILGALVIEALMPYVAIAVLSFIGVAVCTDALYATLTQ